MNIPDSELGASAKSKYRDLFTIYNEYKSLWSGEYKDPASDLIDAAGLLELSDVYTDTVFAFDGFFGFTEQQLRLIKQIIAQSPLCMFAFTTDMESDVFTTVTREVDRLMQLCKNQGEKASLITSGNTAYRFKAPALISAEAHGFDMSEYKSESPLEGIDVFCAKNINEEFGYVAARIKNDVMSGKYRYRDIAVLCPSADEVRYLAASVFEKHGIPVFTDTSKTLITQPLCAFVTGAFDIALRGFEPEYLFPFLKTGLTGISFDDISVLENYVKIWRIRDRGWKESVWTRNPDGITKDATAVDTARLELLNKLKDRISAPLERFKAAVAGKKTGDEILTAIYKLTEEFCVCDNLLLLAEQFRQSGDMQHFDEYTRVYGVFIDMLDSISLSVGKKTFDKRRFYDLFCVCAGTVTIPGRPSRTDEVLFAATGRSRPEGRKCVYVPRMNGSVIPAVRAPSPLITDADKRVFERHNISVSLNCELSAMREHFDFYSAVCTPSEQLVLSYSAFTVTGEALPRSEYLDAIQSAAGVKDIRRNDLDAQFFLVSVAGAAEEAARTGADALYDAIEKKSGIAMRGKRKQDEALSDSIVEALYSRALRLSFSGMESYVNCPFSFFISRGLRAGESEPVQFKTNDIGDFIHKGLEDMLSQDYDISTDEKVKDAVDVISKNYYNTKLADCVGRSKRFDYIFDRSKEALEGAAKIVAEEIRVSDFKPSAFELNISDYGEPIDLENGYSLRLTGFIDRVDRTDDGYFKIIDYKSGKQMFSYDNIYNGLSLQLPVYASAIKSKDPDAKIAAMYYFKVGVPEVAPNGNDGYDDEEYLKKVAEYYKRDGVYSAQDDVLSRIDSTGTLSKSVADDRLLSDKSIERLIEYAKNCLKETGKNITCGNIDVSPLTADACQWCKYKAICRITDGDSRIRKKEKMPKGYFSKGDE